MIAAAIFIAQEYYRSFLSKNYRAQKTWRPAFVDFYENHVSVDKYFQEFDTINSKEAWVK